LELKQTALQIQLARGDAAKISQAQREYNAAYAALYNFDGSRRAAPSRRKNPATAVGAYAGTPHKTIEELIAMAARRAKAGEHPSQIVQDIVDGYSLGWQSKNHRLIENAISIQRRTNPARRARRAAPVRPRQVYGKKLTPAEIADYFARSKGPARRKNPPDYSTEWAAFNALNNSGATREQLHRAAKKLRDPANRRAALRSLGFVTAGDRKISAQRQRAIEEMPQAEMDRHFSFPGAPRRNPAGFVEVVKSQEKTYRDPKTLPKKFHRGDINQTLTAAVGVAARSGIAQFVSAGYGGYGISVHKPPPGQEFYKVFVSGTKATISEHAREFRENGARKANPATKLRAGERQGDIFARVQEPFKLAGEKGTDHERRQREKESKAKATRDFATRNQLDFTTNPRRNPAGAGMTLAEIKAAVEAGDRVFYGNKNYEVIKDNLGQWFIKAHSTNYLIGLTGRGDTLNGKPSDFFTQTRNPRRNGKTRLHVRKLSPAQLRAGFGGKNRRDFNKAGNRVVTMKKRNPAGNELKKTIRKALGKIPATVDEHRNAGGMLKEGLAVFVTESDAPKALRALKAASLKTTWHSPTAIIVRA